LLLASSPFDILNVSLGIFLGFGYRFKQLLFVFFILNLIFLVNWAVICRIEVSRSFFLLWLFLLRINFGFGLHYLGLINRLLEDFIEILIIGGKSHT
jgi:hypothetical protein